MKKVLYFLLPLCMTLSGCFKDDDNLELKSNVLDKDYEGESPFVIVDPEYYVVEHHPPNAPVFYTYHMRFYIDVNPDLLPPTLPARVSCTTTVTVSAGYNSSGWRRFRSTRQVPQGGGTFCMDIYLRDELGYLGHKFNTCVTATG